MQLTGQAQDDLRARKGTCRCCALSAKVGRMVLTFAMVFSEPLSSGRLRSFLGIGRVTAVRGEFSLSGFSLCTKCFDFLTRLGGSQRQLQEVGFA